MKKDYNSGEKEQMNQKISETIKGAPCAEAAAAIAKLEQRQKVVRTGFYLVELPELDEYDPKESDFSLLQYCYYRLIYDVAENMIKELENCQDTAKYKTDMHELVEKFLSLPLRCMSKKNLVLLCNTLMELEFKNYRNGVFSDSTWSIEKVVNTIQSKGGTKELLEVAIDARNRFILAQNKSATDVNKYIIDVIIAVLKGYIFATQNEDQQQISSLRRILGQAIRVYKIPKEKIFISQAAKDRWDAMTDNDINNSKQPFECNRLKEPQDFLLFKKGDSPDGTSTTIKPGQKICFDDMFHIDPIVPIQLIKDKLLGLPMSQITAQNVGRILQKMCVCRILKEENRKIWIKERQTLDCMQIVWNDYNRKDVFIVDFPNDALTSYKSYGFPKMVRFVKADDTNKAHSINCCRRVPFMFFVWMRVAQFEDTLYSICNEEKDFVRDIPVYLRERQPETWNKEEDIVERFGAYFPNTKEGSPYIEIYVDAISEIANKFADKKELERLSEIVLIHELAHAALDIRNYECYSNAMEKVHYNTEFGKWREELMANAITLRVIRDYRDNYSSFLEKNSIHDFLHESEYQDRQKFYDYSAKVILQQNPEYALGVTMADWDYSDFRSVIDGKRYGVEQALQDEWLDYVKNGNPTWEGLHEWNGRLSKHQ